MISLCISVDEVLSESENAITDLKRLKQFILDAPENTFMLEEMSHRVGISPYHMIRKFKAVCGLTPHQFQIQCRVRKAQKLLLKGQSVTEVAYATGFCDQSHFDRCFQKIVRMTPSAYKQSVKRLS
jgi:AraC-like DNA-binding protein